MALATVPEQQGKILIVDDSATNLRLLSDILSASGYEFSLTQDGAAAMRFVQTQLPDLIWNSMSVIFVWVSRRLSPVA